MSTGKVKAVLFIIIGLLVVALVCSWLAGKDGSKGPVNISSTGLSSSAAETPTPAENAPTTSDGTSSYTGNGSNAALNGYINTPNNGNGSNAGIGVTPKPGNTGSNNTGNNTNTTNNTNANNNNSGNTAATNGGDAGSINGANNNVNTDNGGFDLGKDSTAPELTPAPEPAPGENVPAPEPDPQFVRRKLGGAQTYVSNPVAGLALRAEVSCETISANQVEVKIELFAESYSIILNENFTGAGVRLGDVASYVATNAVEKRTNDYGPSALGSKSFIVEITDGNTMTLPVAVEWYYNGNYSGTPIGTLECGGSFTITRA